MSADVLAKWMVFLLDLVDLISFSNLQSPCIWRDGMQDRAGEKAGVTMEPWSVVQRYVCSLLDDDSVERWMCLPLIADSSLHPISQQSKLYFWYLHRTSNLDIRILDICSVFQRGFNNIILICIKVSEHQCILNSAVAAPEVKIEASGECLESSPLLSHSYLSWSSILFVVVIKLNIANSPCSQ